MSKKRGGRPARVDRSDIVAKARELGLGRLSIRRLARELRVGASTIYYHVDSLEELRALLRDDALQELQLAIDDPTLWDETLIASAWALRRVLEASPGLAVEAISDTDWSDAILDLHERVCALLVSNGFTAEDAYLSVRIVAEFVEGFIARRERDLHDPLASSARNPTRPILASAAHALGRAASERRFEFGLERIISGLRIHRRKAAEPRVGGFGQTPDR
ncbi:MAG: TetR/AcrR family transcriptional regulator C-terminal domain-containing protein [Myxococcota bacterium]